MKITATQLYSYLSLPVPENISLELLSVYIDTRIMKREEPSVYIAIQGERFDGHEYFGEAISNGAVICIGNMDYIEKGDEVNFIFVENTQLALQQIAAGIRMDSSIPWVGITGSVGKTTTRSFIGQLLSSQGSTLETIKNNNNQIGVPLTVLNLEENHQFALVEAGTNHFGEIKPLANIIKPNIGVITNIGHTHLEFLENVEGVAREKSELLKAIPENGTAVINHDSPMFEYLKGQCRCKVISFGVNSGDYKIDEKIENGNGCIVNIKGNEYQLPFKESHYLSNFIASLVIALELNISVEEIQKVCKGLKSIAKRLEVLIEDPILLIDDSYNANLDSMKASFEVLHNIAGAQRKIIILGDMKELGEQSDYLHKCLMQELNKFDFDLVLLNGPEITKASEILDMKEVHSFKSKKDLISFCLDSIQKNDAVLVKASQSMYFGEIVRSIKDQWKEED